MSSKTVLKLLNNSKKRTLAVLIDPDKADNVFLNQISTFSNEGIIDLIFVGGSLITSPAFSYVIHTLKSTVNVPVIIFPGSNLHIDDKADALLLLSLVSGRNPDLLIGQHVIAAPRLKRSSLEIIPTAYMLVDGGKPTTVSYISGTLPIPHDKPEIAEATAIASELLGMKVFYLDTGSGALHHASAKMIHKVKNAVQGPVIVGGGINTFEKAEACWHAGADVVVIGSAIEQNVDILEEFRLRNQKPEVGSQKIL